MIEYIAQTGSTNADLAARLREGSGVHEGAWLVTDRQAAGMGRQGRQWSDGAGNFMGSTVVTCRAGDPPAHTLALVTGLALVETLGPLCPADAALCLKWPNDVMISAAKLAGTLLERIGDSVVVGIGVNLAQAPAVEGRETASLAMLDRQVGRNEFAEALARGFAVELGRWRNYGLGPVIARWSRAAHPAGTALSVHQPDGTRLAGTFAGLHEDGSLRLRLADGATRVIHAGDVLLA